MGTDTSDRSLTWLAGKFTPFFFYKVIHIYPQVMSLPLWKPPHKSTIVTIISYILKGNVNLKDGGIENCLFSEWTQVCF